MEDFEKFEKMDFLKDDPHLQLKHISQYQAEKTEVLKLVFHDRYEEAFKLCCKLYEKELEMFGAEHPELLDTKSNLASLLIKVGRQRDSLKLQKELVQTHLKVNGPKHIKTLQCQTTLAKLLRELGQFQEAAQILNDVYEAEKDLKFKDKETIDTLNSLVDIYEKDLKDVEKAIHYLEVKFEFLVNTKKYGREHDETINTNIKLKVMKMDSLK